MSVKCTIDTAAFREALGLVSLALPARSPRAQMLCVALVATKPATLDLVASDGEVWAGVPVGQVDVREAGGLAINGDRLRAVLQAEDTPTLTMETGEKERSDSIRIAGATAVYNMFGYPIKDMPVPPQFPTAIDSDTKTVFRCDLAKLGEALGRVAFAMATENSRYALSGPLLRVLKKDTEIVATDGRRMAILRGAVAQKGAREAHAIIPAKAVSLVRKLAATADPELPTMCDVALTSSGFFCRVVDGPVMSSALVEGAFPPYEEVLPKDHTITVEMERKGAEAAIRRVQAFVDDVVTGSRMEFVAGDGGAGHVQMQSRAVELGDGSATCPTRHEGPSITIGMNARYFLEAVRACPTEKFALEMTAPNKPVVFRSGNLVSVLMPTHLG